MPHFQINDPKTRPQAADRRGFRIAAAPARRRDSEPARPAPPLPLLWPAALRCGRPPNCMARRNCRTGCNCGGGGLLHRQLLGNGPPQSSGPLPYRGLQFQQALQSASAIRCRCDCITIEAKAIGRGPSSRAKLCWPCWLCQCGCSGAHGIAAGHAIGCRAGPIAGYAIAAAGRRSIDQPPPQSQPALRLRRAMQLGGRHNCGCRRNRSRRGDLGAHARHLGPGNPPAGRGAEIAGPAGSAARRLGRPISLSLTGPFSESLSGPFSESVASLWPATVISLSTHGPGRLQTRLQFASPLPPSRPTLMTRMTPIRRPGGPSSEPVA